MNEVAIYCKGELTTAHETVPGTWRCTSCGDKVRVVFPLDIPTEQEWRRWKAANAA